MAGPDPVEERRAARIARERLVLEDRIAQLSRGEFIACENCEDPIPAARLRAVPTATRCWPCQTLVERTDPKIRIAAYA